MYGRTRSASFAPGVSGEADRIRRSHRPAIILLGKAISAFDDNLVGSYRVPDSS